MADRFSVRIDFTEETADYLRSSGLFLLGFKAVSFEGSSHPSSMALAAAAGAVPLVWVSTQKWTASGVTIEWQTQYGAFVSDQDNTNPGAIISAQERWPLDLDQTVKILDKNANADIVMGAPGAVGVDNTDSGRAFTGGMLQLQAGEFQQLCAVPLESLYIKMVPKEQVVFVFAKENIDLGTVTLTAQTKAIAIKLDGQNRARTVVYDKLESWNPEPYATIIPANSSIVEYLINP